MSKADYLINMEFILQWKGDELPDEDQVIAPIKRFVKKTVKAYEKKARLIGVKTNVYEVDEEDEELFKED